MSPPESPRRSYFTVSDEEGNFIPAVEYWAAYVEEDQPAFQVMPLRRFVKLLGIGECLVSQGEDTFVSSRTGRRFVRSSGAMKVHARG